MADLWYYTSEGQPMDPVSRAELKQLADRGMLKPTDLVWTEGMSKWIRAGSAEGIFAAGAAARSGPLARPGETARDEPPAEAADDYGERRPRRRRERDAERWQEDDDFEEAPRRRKKGMGAGAKVAIIVGCVSGFLAIGGVVLYLLLSAGPSQPGTYSVSLSAQRADSRRIEFKSGVQYRITVTSDRNSDVDILIFDKNNQIVAIDESVGPNSLVVWAPKTSGTYRVDIRNLGPGSNRSQVRIEETPIAQVPPPAFKPPDVNPPDVKPPDVKFPIFKDVKPPNLNKPPVNPPLVNLAGTEVFRAQNQLTLNDPKDTVRRGSRCKIFNVKLTAGKVYSIVLESHEFDTYLRVEDSTRRQLAFNDDGHGIFGLNAHIVFTPPANGDFRVVATSFAPSVGSFTLRVIQK